MWHFYLLFNVRLSFHIQISRTRFRLLSLLCITGRFMLMFHYITIATSDSLQSGENRVSSIQGAVLTKHNYASFVVQNMFACYYQCIGDRWCQSLNFYETTKICELNNRTRIVGHLHFQPREGAFYMEKKTSEVLSLFLNFRSCLFSYFVNDYYLMKTIENWAFYSPNWLPKLN